MRFRKFKTLSGDNNIYLKQLYNRGVNKQVILALANIIKRDHSIVSFYQEQKLINLLKQNYINTKQKHKWEVSIWLANKKEIDKINTEEYYAFFNRYNKSLSHKMITEKKDKWEGDPGLANTMIVNAHKSRIRIAKKKYPLIHDDARLLHLSYVDGVATTGKNIAIKLGLDTSKLSKQDLISLSGYSKKTNYRLKSVEEKEKYILKWKQSNMLNLKVRNTIKSSFPEFSVVDVKNMTPQETKMWYSAYISIRSANYIANHPERYNRGYNIHAVRTGYFFSEKNNKDIYYRSSYELQVLQLLELNEKVTCFETEPYHMTFETDKKKKKCYVPDIIFTTTSEEQFILEIKPKIFLERFNEEKGRYIKELHSNFFIITEEIIFNKEKFYEYFRIN